MRKSLKSISFFCEIILIYKINVKKLKSIACLFKYNIYYYAFIFALLI